MISSKLSTALFHRRPLNTLFIWFSKTSLEHCKIQTGKRQDILRIQPPFGVANAVFSLSWANIASWGYAYSNPKTKTKQIQPMHPRLNQSSISDMRLLSSSHSHEDKPHKLVKFYSSSKQEQRRPWTSGFLYYSRMKYSYFSIKYFPLKQ